MKVGNIYVVPLNAIAWPDCHSGNCTFSLQVLVSVEYYYVHPGMNLCCDVRIYAHNQGRRDFEELYESLCKMAPPESVFWEHSDTKLALQSFREGDDYLTASRIVDGKNQSKTKNAPDSSQSFLGLLTNGEIIAASALEECMAKQDKKNFDRHCCRCNRCCAIERPEVQSQGCRTLAEHLVNHGFDDLLGMFLL